MYFKRPLYDTLNWDLGRQLLKYITEKSNNDIGIMSLVLSKEDEMLQHYLLYIYLYEFKDVVVASDFKLVISIEPIETNRILLSMVNDTTYYQCGFVVVGVYSITGEGKYVFPDGYTLFYGGRQWGTSWNVSEVLDNKLVVKFINAKMYVSLMGLEDPIADGSTVFGMM